MEFKVATADDGTKVLQYREHAGGQLVTINLGNVTPPTDPAELFGWLTGKLKDHGLVSPSMVFRLNS